MIITTSTCISGEQLSAIILIIAYSSLVILIGVNLNKICRYVKPKKQDNIIDIIDS